MNNDKKTNTSLSEWTEQLNSHFDKLRNNVDIPADFSLHEALQNSWKNVKSLPPTLVNNYKDPLAGRNPVPVNLLDNVHPCEFETRIRYVGNEPLALNFADKAINVLTVSSGGAKGAYGAGILAGWQEKGDLPEFDMMMGVSTGAIIALFTFINKIETLQYFYNEYSSVDLVEKQVIQGLMSGSSIYDNAKFNQLLNDYIDDVLVKQLAIEAEKGRVLLIGTTNLDRGMLNTWDLTAVARTNSPYARQLIADIILASCAIPVAFPPVLVPVTDKDGNEYDELHVDGAAAQQLLIEVPAKNATIYAVVNKSLVQTYQPAGMDILDIGNKSLSSALANGIIGDLYRLYMNAERNGSAFHATWMPETFTDTPTEIFDVDYMRQLYALGHECALLGKVWHEVPPDW